MILGGWQTPKLDTHDSGHFSSLHSCQLKTLQFLSNNDFSAICNLGFLIIECGKNTLAYGCKITQKYVSRFGHYVMEHLIAK